MVTCPVSPLRPGKIDVLPGISYLQRCYTYYNKVLFDGQCPEVEKVKIVWRNGMKKAAGRCWKSKNKIAMSIPYFNEFPEEILNVLVHEMIHLVDTDTVDVSGKLVKPRIKKGHGPSFDSWMRRINSTSTSPKITVTMYCVPKLLYRCESGHEIKSSLLINTKRSICVKCRGKIHLEKRLDGYVDTDDGV